MASIGKFGYVNKAQLSPSATLEEIFIGAEAEQVKQALQFRLDELAQQAAPAGGRVSTTFKVLNNLVGKYPTDEQTIKVYYDPVTGTYDIESYQQDIAGAAATALAIGGAVILAIGGVVGAVPALATAPVIMAIADQAGTPIWTSITDYRDAVFGIDGITEIQLLSKSGELLGGFIYYGTLPEDEYLHEVRELVSSAKDGSAFSGFRPEIDGSVKVFTRTNGEDLTLEKEFKIYDGDLYIKAIEALETPYNDSIIFPIVTGDIPNKNAEILVNSLRPDLTKFIVASDEHAVFVLVPDEEGKYSGEIPMFAGFHPSKILAAKETNHIFTPNVLIASDSTALPVITHEAVKNGSMLIGTGRQDNLIGASTDDLLIGLEGKDTLEGGGGNDTVLAGDQNFVGVKISGGLGNNVLFGGNGTDYIISSGENDMVMGGAETDALAQYGGAGESYSELTELHGGFIDATTGESTDDNATDHYGVFGWSKIKEAETEDLVYVNNLQVTGGVKLAVWDENVAWNPMSGHGFQLYGDSANKDGATLAVKWLWDNDNIAFVENYTHRYLEKGDGNIEVYEEELVDQWEALNNLWKTIQAIRFYRSNPDGETLAGTGDSGSSGGSGGSSGGSSGGAAQREGSAGVGSLFPFLKGYGALQDFDLKAASDSTLAAMVSGFTARNPAAIDSFNADVEALLYRWAGVEQVADGSRGTHVDAKKLAFLEAYTGEAFVSDAGTHSNPQAIDAAALENAWNAYFTEARALLLAQTVYADHFSNLSVQFSDGRFTSDGFQLRSVLADMLDAMPADTTAARAYWQQIAPVLQGMKGLVEREVPITEDFFGNAVNDVSVMLGMNDQQLLTDITVVASGRSLPLPLHDLLDMVNQESFLQNMPELHVTSADGNALVSEGKNNVVMVDTATATIDDVNGSDAYIIGASFFDVTIYDSETSGYVFGNVFASLRNMFDDTDTLRFTHLLRENATVSRDGDDLLIMNNIGGGEVRVTNHFLHTPASLNMSLSGSSKQHGIEQITFADGKAMTTVDIREEIITAQQTDGNDYIKGTSDSEIIHGQKGTDTLVGGDSGDMYKFNAGDGSDLIRDHQTDFYDERPDQVKFGAGLGLENATLIRGNVDASDVFSESITGDSLKLSFSTGDTLVIDGQFWTTALGTGTFDALGVALNALVNWPLLGLLGGYIPDDFDNYGTENDLGLTLRTDPATNQTIVEIRDTDYFYVAPSFAEIPSETPDPSSLHSGQVIPGTNFADIALSDTPYAPDDGEVGERYGILPTPDNRMEFFTFMDGYVLSAKDMHQAYLDQFNRADADKIVAFHEAETLAGGAGNDTLTGGDDGDTYLFNLGDGQDIIEESQTNVLFKRADRIKFGEGITADNISLRAENDKKDLLISFNNADDSILIKGQLDAGVFGWNNFYTLEQRIELFEFKDGTVLTANDMTARLLNPTSGHDVLTGNADNDILYGGNGGNDTLIGGDGGDAYIFGFGDAQDIIQDEMFSALNKNLDSIYFGSGVTKDNLQLSRPQGSDDLLISLVRNGQLTGDTLTIRDQFNPNVFGYEGLFSVDDKIEIFLFQNGSGLTYKDVMELLLRGTDGDDYMEGFFKQDTFDGGLGNDTYYGDGEADTYIFKRGYGQDVIIESRQVFENTSVDTVRFTGLKLEDVTFSRLNPLTYSDSLVISIKNSTDTLTIKDVFANWYKEVERFEFDDVSLKLKDIQEIIVQQGTSGNDNSYGFHMANDSFITTTGKDTLQGGDGDDIYRFRLGSGHDVISDDRQNISRSDNDTIMFEQGITPENVLLERQNNDLLISFAQNSSDSLRIKDHFNNFGNYRINSIQFSDAQKTTWDLDKINEALYSTTSGNDLLNGYLDSNDRGYNEVMHGGAGNDTLIADNSDTLYGGSGNDLYIYNDTIVPFFTEASYIREAGDGGNDTLRLREGFGLNDLDFSREDNNLIIESAHYSSDGIYVTLSDYFLSQTHQVETLQLQQNGNITSYNLVNIVTQSSSGTDRLLGGDTSETLTGLGGHDYLLGYDGYDTLIGGSGNDWLAGDAKDDTYLYFIGDGNDTIFDQQRHVSYSMQDIIRFGTGINPDATRLQRSGTAGENLQITFNGISGSILVEDFFGSLTYNQVEILEFDDGTVWGLRDIYAALPAQPEFPELTYDITTSTITGSNASETVSGSDGHERFIAGKDNDSIHIFDGSDTIAYALGDGNDSIGHNGSYAQFSDAEIDHVILSGGITIDNTTLTRTGYQGSNLMLNFSDGGSLTFENQFNGGYARIEYIHFSDGSVFDYKELARHYFANAETASNDTITGTSGDDVFVNGAGNDVLNGTTGSDTYEFGIGGGHDSISSLANSADPDMIRFTNGISLSDVILERTGYGNDFRISLSSTDSITIVQQLASNTGKISYFAFADGVYNWQQLSQHYVDRQQNSSNNTIYSTRMDNTIIGGAGNDTIHLQFGGSDTIIYTRGDGKDSIHATDTSLAASPDTLIIRDILSTEASFTRINNGHHELRIDLPDNGSITIKGQLQNNNTPIETILFEQDNISFTPLDILAKVATAQPGADDDYLIGTTYFDAIHGLEGNDTLDGSNDNFRDSLYGGAGDDVFIGRRHDMFDGGEDEDTVDLSDQTINWYINLDEDEILSGSNGATAVSIEHVIGGQGNDTFLGSNGNNFYHGHNGNDTINAGYGHDTLNGGAGRDTLDGGSGNDIFRFSSREDSTLQAADYVKLFTIGADIIDLSGLGFSRLTRHIPTSADEIQLYFDARPSAQHSFLAAGNNATDFAFYLQGDLTTTLSISDIIFDATSITDTSLNNDMMQLSGNAHRYIHAMHGNDTINAAAGDDTLIGGRGDDSLLGGAGNDSIYAGENSDILHGGSGNDTMEGNSGRDTLIGGVGADELRGGSGRDVFVYTDWQDSQKYGTSGDIIKDFNVNDDVIDLSALGVKSFIKSGVSDEQSVKVAGNGTHTFISTAGDNAGIFQIVLEGDYRSTITAANFIFATTSSSEAGFRAKYYTVPTDVDALADIDFAANPIHEEVIDQINFSGSAAFYTGGKTDYFAAQYDGVLQIEQAGNYTFFLRSDDGSTLSINGTQLINNDGLHAARELSGTMYLEAGEHQLNARYFEKAGGQVMQLYWQQPGTTSKTLLSSADVNTAPLQVLPANTAPIAQNDTVSGEQDSVITGNVLSNDSDADNDALSATVLANPANGTVDLNQNGSFTYTPQAGFFGTDSFTYTLDDGKGGTDSATVNLSIAEIASVPITSGLTLDFNTVSLNAYWSGQDKTGTVDIIENGAGISLTGNLWKQAGIGDYTITDHTRMSFDFRSTNEGEEHGIVLDADNSPGNGNDVRLRFFGSQFSDYQLPEYTGNGNWQAYEMHVASTGVSGIINRIAFMNDDDLDSNGNGQFRNVRLWEDTPTADYLDFNALTMSGYSDQDTATATVQISDAGKSIAIGGNTWKAFALPEAETFTADSVLRFDFKSTAEGEIQGIGFDNDNRWDNGQPAWQLLGTQQIAFTNDDVAYTNAGDWQSFSISLAEYAGQSYSHMFLMNDNDANLANVDVQFRNIEIIEG